MSHENRGSSPQFIGDGFVQRLARQLRYQYKLSLATAIVRAKAILAL